jgi:hypothetical protein
MRHGDDMQPDPRITARDQIIRLASTPAHAGDLDAAAEELAARPHWQTRRNTLRSGLGLARALVAVWGSAKQAERAIDGETQRAMERLLDRETAQ